MICPKCGAKTKVRDIVQNDFDNETLRQKSCPTCGHVFYTVESETANNSEFNKKWYQNHRAYSQKKD